MVEGREKRRKSLQAESCGQQWGNTSRKCVSSSNRLIMRQLMTFYVNAGEMFPDRKAECSFFTALAKPTTQKKKSKIQDTTYNYITGMYVQANA